MVLEAGEIFWTGILAPCRVIWLSLRGDKKGKRRFLLIFLWIKISILIWKKRGIRGWVGWEVWLGESERVDKGGVKIVIRVGLMFCRVWVNNLYFIIL